ncbi:MAG: hypothetical protein M3383_04060 [Actinomycetota bacterium]|nr:hypothetical protein [Actinomycetota bacterium]
MNDSPLANRTGIAAAILIAIALLVAIAAIFGLGPCADDLSREEYVSQGDEICAEAHQEFLDLQTGTPRTAADAAELMAALIAVAEEERDAIAELQAPPDLVDRVAKYLDARQAGIAQLKAGLAAAEDEDPQAYERVQGELEQSQKRRYALAREVGFKECSKPIARPVSSDA